MDKDFEFKVQGVGFRVPGTLFYGDADTTTHRAPHSATAETSDPLGLGSGFRIYGLSLDGFDSHTRTRQARIPTVTSRKEACPLPTADQNTVGSPVGSSNPNSRTKTP